MVARAQAYWWRLFNMVPLSLPGAWGNKSALPMSLSPPPTSQQPSRSWLLAGVRGKGPPRSLYIHAVTSHCWNLPYNLIYGSHRRLIGVEGSPFSCDSIHHHYPTTGGMRRVRFDAHKYNPLHINTNTNGYTSLHKDIWVLRKTVTNRNTCRRLISQW